jgi:hypothetical protein
LTWIEAGTEDFLTWIVHDGQKSVETFYAPLPEPLVERADAIIKRIKARP